MKSPILRVVLPWIALATLVAGPDAHAQPPGVPEPVVVGVLRDWPPRYALDDDGEPDGFAVDVIEDLADRTGLKLTYRVYGSFPELIAALEADAVDLVPNMGITEERAEGMLFTRPYETFVVSLFTRTDAPDTEGIRGLGDLRERRIAVVQTNVAERLIEPPEYRPVVHESLEEALFALLAGHVDGLVYPRSVVVARSRQIGIRDRIRVAGPPLLEIKRAIAVRRGLPTLRAVLDSRIDDYVGSPEYRETYVAWFGADDPLWTPRRVLVGMLVVLAVGLLGMGLWRHASLVRARNSLRRQEERLDAILRNVAEGILLVDADGTVIYANPRVAEITGYELDELVGEPVDVLSPGPDTFPGFDTERRLRDRLAGRSETYETSIRSRDGELVWIEVHAAPLRDESGEITGSVSAITDITERKRTEAALREREEELRQAQKLESIGRLTGGIAHDFNNVLTVVLGHVDLVLDALSLDHPQREEVEEIRRAGRRAADLTRQLLAFSRKQVLEPAPVDLVEAVAETRSMLDRLLQEDIRIEVRHGDDLGAVEFDPSGLQQVLVNLILNAQDAMPEGGTVTITTANVDRRDVTLDSSGGDSTEDRHGSYVLLEVHDEGTGIPDRDLPHIFEPFFTTKGTGEGTGLGLATVHGIVEQSQGFIEVDTREGEGTAFRVFLPRAAHPPREERAPPPDAVGGTEPRRVLLVEDEPAVRALLERVLSGRGFRVHAAISAEDALDDLDHGRIESPDLLITDVVMPGVGGPELARRLRGVRPDLPVVLISGYSAERHPWDDLRGPRTSFLRKPLSTEELLGVIDALLERVRE